MCGDCVKYETLSPAAQAERRTRLVKRRIRAVSRVEKAKAVRDHILERTGDIETQQAAIIAARKAWTQAEARKSSQALTNWLNAE